MSEVTHQLAPQRRPDAGAGAVAASSAPAILGSHDGSGLRIGVVCARFNDDVTERLLDGALRALEECGVPAEHRIVAWVPGSFELPLVAQALAASEGVDGVVCLGAVIRGETAHFDFVAGQCAAGLQRVQLDTGVPVAFGVLTTENLFQALERSGGSYGNKGSEAVITVVETANVLRAVAAR